MSYTDPEVAAAEQEAAEAQSLADSLERAIRDGDATITHDEFTRQKSLVGFLRLQVEGAKTKATARRAQARVEALQSLRDEILTQAPESGEKLVKLLMAVDKASRAFYESSLAHDAKLREWVTSLERFGIAEGQQEQGVGLNGIKQVVLGSIVLEQAHGAQHLNKLYTGNSDPYGSLIPSADDSGRVAETLKDLHSIGKAA